MVLGMVVHAFNPGTQEGERQTHFCDFEASKFHDSQGYVARHGLKGGVGGAAGMQLMTQMQWHTLIIPAPRR